jgi:hypothetical protein
VTQEGIPASGGVILRGAGELELPARLHRDSLGATLERDDVSIFAMRHEAPVRQP